MVAIHSQFAAAHAPIARRPFRTTQVRYQSPDDLLPWADPYIASLFAQCDDEQGRNDDLEYSGTDYSRCKSRNTQITAGG